MNTTLYEQVRTKVCGLLQEMRRISAATEAMCNDADGNTEDYAMYEYERDLANDVKDKLVDAEILLTQMDDEFNPTGHITRYVGSDAIKTDNYIKS